MKRICGLTLLLSLVCIAAQALELEDPALKATALAARDARAGEVMTVTGLISPSEMGFTLPHEHLLITHQGAGIDLTNVTVATNELQYFKNAVGEEPYNASPWNGKGTLVEMTNTNISRNPTGLKTIAEATGVNVIMGSGYYKEGSGTIYYQTAATRAKTVQQLAADIVSDFVYGVPDGQGGTIYSGVIGEVGVSRYSTTAFEDRSLQATAIAQQVTGLPINMHFDYETSPSRRGTVLAQLDGYGADLSRLVISHVIPQTDTYSYNQLVSLFETGAYLELDYFGLEVADAGIGSKLTSGGADDPGLFITKAFQDGFGDQLLLSQDVCLQGCYHSHSPPGLGYDALQNVYLDEMRAVGVTEQQIYQMTVVNPQRVYHRARAWHFDAAGHGIPGVCIRWPPTLQAARVVVMGRKGDSHQIRRRNRESKPGRRLFSPLRQFSRPPRS